MIATARASWADTTRVKVGWTLPRRQTAAEWAAENRVLDEKDSAEPGPWSNLRAPYLVEIMNALADPEITDVVIMKAAQVGLSEAVRNAVGYWIDQDPGPLLWVMPDETSAKEILSEKLGPMIRRTPRLAAHATERAHDIGKKKILLDNMDIHAAWAGSPQSLATRPKRRVIYDEADKYPAWSGKESDPIALGNKRTTTYGHRAKRVILGTPTTRLGPIWRGWDDSPVKLRHHVPCRRCGEYSALSWSQIRWPSGIVGTRAEQGQAIEDQGLAWFECPRCSGRVEERERQMMLAPGVWAADGHETVAPDGSLIGKRPASRRVAFQVPATISPWVAWSQMGGEFVAAVGDESRMMDWRNSRLGEPYEVRAASIKSDAFDEKIRAGHAPGVVPRWAGMLLATADTQKDHFWFVIRAWGHGFRSRLIDYGRLETFDQLRERCLQTRYLSEDPGFSPLAAHMLCIDSGGGADVGADQSRTHQVYQFALTDPARIYACKGFGGARELEVPVRQAFVAYSSPDGQVQTRVALYHLKGGYFKDVLARRIAQPAGQPDDWELHSGCDRDYTRQMASEHKVLLRQGRQQVARWVPVTASAANHLWDCEYMQVAAAQIAHVETLPPEAELASSRRVPKSAGYQRGGDTWDSAVGDP